MSRVIAAPAEPLLLVSGSDSPEIRVARFDPATGAVGPQKSFDAGPGSGYLAFHPTGRFVYGINRTPAKVLAWAVDAERGELQPLNQVAVPAANGPTHLSVHPSGRWLFVAYFLSGHLSVHPLGDDGRVGEATQVLMVAPNAHQAVTAPGGKLVLVPCRDGNVVATFAFDEATGRVTPVASVTGAPGVGPRHLAFHPSGRFVYVMTELVGTVVSYRYDVGTGALADPEALPSVPAGASENAGAHIEVHPSGRFVYASNRAHGSLGIWRVDPASGRLGLLGFENTGGQVNGPRDFTLDAGGRFLLVANMGAGTLLVFAIAAEGTLVLRHTVPVQAKPTFVGLLLP